jgi:CheY-like chemotaxis protein
MDLHRNNSKTILVVEDQDDARSFLVQYLVLEGYRVEEAENGREATEAVRRRSPDLILMDLNMPEMDGFSAAEQINRYKDLFGEIPIIAMTAYDTHGMKEAALRAGCRAYMRKPLDIQHLNEVISGIVGLDSHTSASKARLG